MAEHHDRRLDTGLPDRQGLLESAGDQREGAQVGEGAALTAGMILMSGPASRRTSA